MECPRCRPEHSTHPTFCDEFGQSKPLTSAARPVPSSRFGSPETYTPKHVAQSILTARTTLEGERKHVTVLFADIKNSTDSFQLFAANVALFRRRPCHESF